MLDRFSNHQINAPSSCKLSLKVLLQKETWGYAKVIHKKRKKVGEMEKCPRYKKQWVLRCPPKEKTRYE
jgi:hypothetical protein